MSFLYPKATPATFIRDAETPISQRSDGVVLSWTFTTEAYAAAHAWVMAGGFSGDYLRDTAANETCPIPIESVEFDGVAESFAKIVVRFKLSYSTSEGANGGAEKTVDGETISYEMESADLTKPLATNKLFLTAFNAAMTLNKPANMKAAQDAQFVKAFGSTFPRATHVIELAEAGVRIPEARGVILLCGIAQPLLVKYWLRMDAKRDSWQTSYPVLTRTTRRAAVKSGDYHGYLPVMNSAPSGFPDAPSMKYWPQPSRVSWDPSTRTATIIERFIGIDDFDAELYSE